MLASWSKKNKNKPKNKTDRNITEFNNFVDFEPSYNIYFDKTFNPNEFNNQNTYED